MSLVKVVVVCALAALLVSACGIQPKPEAGSGFATFRKSGDWQARVDNPVRKQVECLKQYKVKYRLYITRKQQLPAIQLGKAPEGPLMVFYPTAGIAQGLQIMGEEQGAEVINATLLYPNEATGKLLNEAEECASPS
jgi:hypothetical protein